ncbi:Uncharacterised protein [Niallia circulans]|jgi:hypothetical protein|nr:Uncharacterised protein [Niallia circulans]
MKVCQLPKACSPDENYVDFFVIFMYGKRVMKSKQLEDC